MLKFGMKTLHNKRIDVVAAAVLVAVGLLVGFWPLCLAGVVFAALVGRWVSAFLLGLLMDVIYGAPTGFLHVLYFPFALCALASILVRSVIIDRIRATHTDRL